MQQMRFARIFCLTSTILALTSLTSGCGSGNGLKVASALLAKTPGNSNQIPLPKFDAADLSGSAAGGPTGDQTIIVYDISEQAIQLRIPMAGITSSGEMGIPNVSGSRVYVDTTNPLLPVLVVSVPGMYVLGKMGFEPGEVALDPSRLPNGDPLPFTPGGEPPKISFLIPNINRTVQVYLGVNVVAVFVGAPFDPMVNLTFPIRNHSKTETIGYFSTVSRRLPFQGGFFVSLDMPREIAGALDDYLRKVVVP